MTTLVSPVKPQLKSNTTASMNPFAGFGKAIIAAFEKSAEQQAIRSLQHFSASQLETFGTSHAELAKRIRQS